MTTMTTAHADTASSRQLNWAVAKISGMAMREPVPARDEDFKHKMAPFKLFDVVAVGEDSTPAFDVREVTVTRIDIKKGSSGVTVETEYFDHAKRKWDRARASLDFYFATREEAELDVIASMKGTYNDDFTPVLDWVFVGEFIDDMGIMFSRVETCKVRAFLDQEGSQGEQPSSIGDNHREAAVRLYVKTKLGDQFEVPKWL